MNSKLLIISGATATGKTDLGIHFAKKLNGEIISADTRQVYKGMDVLTGKDIDVNEKLKIKNKKLQIKNQKFTVGYRLKNEIPIWLVDIVAPDYVFNVGEYYRLAKRVIIDIYKRGKLPILVGGTGFYIKSIINPVDTLSIPPDNQIRKELSTLNLESLRKRIEVMDYKRWIGMNESDRHNPRRLIRAIEVAIYKNKNSQFPKLNNVHSYSICWIGLKTSNDILYKRINLRVEKRIKEGVIEETRKLINAGYDLNLPSLSSTGFSVLKKYIENKITLEDTIKIWKCQEHGYARRQMTWFMKERRIEWFDIFKIDYIQKIEDKIREWYTQNS